MKTNIKINYTHVWVDHPLYVKLMVNDRLLNFDVSGNQDKNIDKDFNLDDNEYEFKMQITGKNNKNTLVDHQGIIVEDSFIKITDLQFNNISVLNMLENQKNFGVFVSDDPKNRIAQTSKFGHNGILIIPFKVPIYNWLLDRMFDYGY